ncbi:MAG: type IV pilus assembly protein PilM [Pseudomonadota bacterium]|nr:type IV pilus assembly protein PilM [Pseudomonadota bacterium]
MYTLGSILNSIFSKSIVSIDIGTSSIKAIELAGKGNKRTMSRIAMELLPQKVVDSGAIIDKDALKNSLLQLLRRLKVPPAGQQVGISLNGSSVVIKRVNLTKSKHDPDFYEYIYHEAEQYLQHDISDLYLDWEFVQDRYASASVGTAIILVGAKRDAVEDYTSLVESLGMKVAIVDCDALAAINALEFNANIKNEFVCLVNIGYASTQVSLLIGNSFVFTREVPIGGANYTNGLIEAMNLDYQSADTLKITVSLGSRAAPKECVELFSSIHQDLINEINLTIEQYVQENQTDANSVILKKVFLTGGGSRILGLDALIAETLKSPVEYLFPFKNVSINLSKVPRQFIENQWHMFGVSLGLALRKIDEKKHAQ